MTDERIERVIGLLLQTGVLISALIVMVGGAWLLADRGAGPANYARFTGVQGFLRSPAEVLRSLSHPQPATIVQLGLLLLIATPVLRVAFSLAAFALQRDWIYVAITLVVLLVLGYSLAVPHGAG